MLNKLLTGKNPFVYRDNNTHLSEDFIKLFIRMTSENPDAQHWIKDIFESDWLKKTSDMFKTKDKRLQYLEGKVKEILENKKEKIYENRLKITENKTLTVEI